MNDLHYIIILQRSFAPIKKRLPNGSEDQLKMIKELMVEYPDALMAVFEVCDHDIFMWNSRDFLQMIGGTA